MVARWVVVDKLVHELGSLRAAVEEVETHPDLAEDSVTVELRDSLARAADTIHLVIGGNEGMVSQAWRRITEAQEAEARLRVAMASARSAAAGSARDGKRVTPAAALLPREHAARARPPASRGARPPRS
jgi:hypothetical protein